MSGNNSDSNAGVGCTNKPLWRWVIPFLTSSLIFVNHYCRDSVGALEKQLESEVGITPSQYGTLNSLYFLPNVITPLLVGTAAESLGGAPMCLMCAVLVASLGHVIFAFAVEISSVNLLFVGRILAGSVYEVIDFLPIVCTGALFKDEWGTIVGATNAFLRSGSVATFVICPLVYHTMGLKPAMWFSAALAALSITFSMGAYVLIRKLSELYAASPPCSEDSPKPVASPEKSAAGFMSSPVSAYARRRTASELSAASDGSLHTEGESSSLLSLEPFRRLSYTYYLYMGAGLFLYGSMVPFWFTGSKYLQEYYGMSVQAADGLLLIPEGSIIVLSFPLGYLLDNHLSSAPLRLASLGLSTLLLPVGYCMLMLGGVYAEPVEGGEEAIPRAYPLLAMLFLGLGYGISNCMYWTSLMQIVPEELIGPASGLIASSLNVMPAVVPVVSSLQVSFTSSGNWNLIVLTVLGVASTSCAMMASNRIAASPFEGGGNDDTMITELSERERLVPRNSDIESSKPNYQATSNYPQDNK
mmetsp:Transcript_21637/g.31490  ORF Transcript_21637/g.31490 Transcript_21637/m.31490 type:complete len:528 (-) Transcript_21637:122-1705(-)